MISILKNSALMLGIGLAELTFTVQKLSAETFRTVELFVVLGIVLSRPGFGSQLSHAPHRPSLRTGSRCLMNDFSWIGPTLKLVASGALETIIIAVASVVIAVVLGVILGVLLCLPAGRWNNAVRWALPTTSSCSVDFRYW